MGRKTKRERALDLGATIDDFDEAQVTEWGFDDNGRLDSHKDDGANETTWEYDALDRKTKMIYPDSTEVAWEYDDAHNVTKITDAAGNVITDMFDELNRRTARTITLATGFGGTTSESFGYDGVSRMTTADDNDYDVTLQYAVIGLQSFVYSEKQEYATGTPHAKTVTKTYDAVGNKVTEDYPSGLSLDYTYNGINALADIDEGTTSIASYEYIGPREKKVTFGNDTTQTNDWGKYRSRLTAIHHEDSSSNTLVELQYGYNDVHDRTYERYGGTSASGDAFEYDMMRRLTRAWMGSTNPSSPTSNTYDETIEFNMDDDGNRTSKVVTPYGQSASTTNYTTNGLNQYTAVGGTTHTYDDNGNLTDDGNQEYVYDYQNRLIEVKVSGGASIATYRYDAIGRRVEKDVGATGIERHVLSGEEVVETCDGVSTWKQRYVYGRRVDQIVVLEQADVLDVDGDSDTNELVRNFYHRNALGSVIYVSESDETEAATYRYRPYGVRSISRGGSSESSDPLGQVVGFTGRWWDAEAELWCYRARHLGAGLGRFSQRDPEGVVEGPSLMEYVRSSPTRLVDVSGRRGSSAQPPKANKPPKAGPKDGDRKLSAAGTPMVFKAGPGGGWLLASGPGG